MIISTELGCWCLMVILHLVVNFTTLTSLHFSLHFCYFISCAVYVNVRVYIISQVRFIIITNGSTYLPICYVDQLSTTFAAYSLAERQGR